MNIYTRVCRFQFTIGNFKTEDVYHVRTTFTKSPYVFAIVVKYKEKLFGFVRSKKQKTISSLQTKIGHQAQIEGVNRCKCDAEVEARYHAMICDGGDEIVRFGASHRRKLPRGRQKKGTVVPAAADSTTSCVKKMWIDENVIPFSRLDQRHRETTAVSPHANVVLQLDQRHRGTTAVSPHANVVSSVNETGHGLFKKAILMRYQKQMNLGVPKITESDVVSSENKTDYDWFKKNILMRFQEQMAVGVHKRAPIPTLNSSFIGCNSEMRSLPGISDSSEFGSTLL